MNKDNFKALDKYRVKSGMFASKDGDDFGFFFIPYRQITPPLKVMCAPSDSEWQHVSVSMPNRCPTWDEMCFIKNLFWGEGCTVAQFHPPKSEYVNNAQFCLHLWRKSASEFELPPSSTVGIKELGVIL